MEQKNSFWNSQFVKIAFICLLALVMLIPLSMVRSQIGERESHYDASVEDITHNWGCQQTLDGPWIKYKYQKPAGNGIFETVESAIGPDSLVYNVKSTSRELHRSIYDVTVYTADITIEGSFLVDGHLQEVRNGDLVLRLSGLKGIQGMPVITLGGNQLKVKSDGSNLKSEITLAKETAEGDRIPFRIEMKFNGSRSLYFRPAGNLTEVFMTSDYPDPSFGGDFLPIEREVGPEGFTARWSVSQITITNPSTDSFGVSLEKPVTQYRQTERAIKYGILVIFLIFFAGFAVEMISKKPINFIQYIVIGASLVLFYALLLAFSDFLAFGLSYLIAAAMTTIALGAYFIAIVKGKWAYILTALVALAYLVIYILLQMETFAFLAGTLLLFAILCLVMYLTRNLQKAEDAGVQEK